MINAASHPTEVNPAKLAMLYKRELELCKVKRGETIALVSDLGTRREYYHGGFAAAESSALMLMRCASTCIPGWTKVGVPTIGQCKGTLEALKAADIIVIFHVPLFAAGSRRFAQAGARVLMIIDAPDDLEQLIRRPV